MKLYYSANSPFARKVILCAQYLGLADEIELVSVDVFATDRNYLRINPLNKIPALETRDGQILANSPFICEYLDSLSFSSKVLPQGPDHWSVLHRQAIADGVMEAAVLRRHESLRSPDQFDSSYDQRQKEKISEGLSFLQNELPQFKSFRWVDTFAVQSVLWYLEHRFAHEAWPEKFPQLKQWYLSMTTTI